MSIYGYILCVDCRERYWLKDTDTQINGDLEVAGRFFEDHRGHQEYVHEDDDRTHDGGTGYADYKTNHFDL